MELAKKKGYKAIAILIDIFPNNVAVVSLKQTTINAINKYRNDKIKLPSNYPKLLLQHRIDDAIKNDERFQLMLAKNESKKDDKK